MGRRRQPRRIGLRRPPRRGTAACCWCSPIATTRCRWSSLLQRVLGGLRSPVAIRVALGPLSARAVTRLAGEPGAGLRVHASTGGNPFFVTELLAAEHEGLPASVSQAGAGPGRPAAGAHPGAAGPARRRAGAGRDRAAGRRVSGLAGGRGGGRGTRGAWPCTVARWRFGTSWPAGRSRRRCPGRGHASCTPGCCPRYAPGAPIRRGWCTTPNGPATTTPWSWSPRWRPGPRPPPAPTGRPPRTTGGRCSSPIVTRRSSGPTCSRRSPSRRRRRA